MARAAERIGVFGGTFDPPTVGHVSVARDAADALRLDRLLWVPARRSPLKPDAPVTPDATRLEMVRAAASADPRFTVDVREMERPPPSYMVDTLEGVRAEVGRDAQLFLIMGIDQYRDFDRWRDPQRIRSLATVAVMDREGVALAEGRHGIVDGVRPLAERPPGAADGARRLVEGGAPRRVPVTRVDVSATEVRRRLERGESVDRLVPPGVAEIIAREGLYRGGGRGTV